jgi:hypothetical protein
MTIMNGHGHDAPAVTMVPFTVRQAGPVSAWPPRQDEAPAKAVRNAVDGDRVIRTLTAVVVLAVAAIAAIVSYSHIYALGRGHGQDGTAARLLPLSVDGLIAAASLVMLHAARNDITMRKLSLSRIMLALGVGATVAANVAYGLPFGWLGAVVSAWPAVAFVGSVEMAVKFVRDARAVATATAGGTTASVADGGLDGDSRDDKNDDSQPPPDPPNPPPDDDKNDDKDDDKNPPPPPPPDPPNPRQRRQSGRARAAAILSRNPGLTDAELARKASVSERTAQRARSDVQRPRG